MAITASQVNELRQKTGAGMMDCKKALTEADGNFEKAIEILRKKGAAVAAKRADRSANEGIVLTKVTDDFKKAYMVEVNCETDFVAKSNDFLNFANKVLDTIVANDPKNLEELYATNNLANDLQDLIGKIGEKIEVSRFVIESTENGCVNDYVHHGNKLAIIIRADNLGNSDVEELKVLLRNIAMQVASMNPLVLYREEVPTATIEKEIEIYKDLARKEGKPENILERIAVGKLEKFYEENCLFEQVYVKDNSKKIKDLVADFNKKYNSEVKLVKFYRYHLSDTKK
jgi:elongation factor Ts